MSCTCRYRWDALCAEHGLSLEELDQRKAADDAEHARIVERFEANKRLRPMDPMQAIDNVLIDKDFAPETTLGGSDEVWGP